MTVLIRSSRHSAAELVSVLDGEAPAAWQRTARSTGWGCVAWAGEEVAVVGSWLVLGVPSSDPWGWPGRRLLAEDLALRLTTFGPEAVRTASGPFLVVDLSDGSVTRPANGLVPFWEGDGFGSTSQQVAGPGAILRPVLPHTGGERGARTSLGGRRVRAELLEHRPSGTCDDDVHVPGSRDPLWRGDAPARLKALRREVSARWWTARLEGRWLHAPALERPVVDRLLEVGS